MDFEEAKLYLQKLSTSQTKVYLIGSVVRDILLDTKPISVNKSVPAGVINIFAINRDSTSSYELGVSTAFSLGKPYSLTETLKEDILRRDFTINSLALDANGTVYDSLGGVMDIENKVIRSIGDPYKSVCKNPIRILKAIRLASVLGFTIESKTLAAIVSCQSRLKHVSRERQFDELTKTLLGENVRCLVNFKGLIFKLIPELLEMETLGSSEWDNTLHICESVTASTTLRWAALFCNVGNGAISRELSSQLAKKALIRLKAHRSIVSEVSWLIANCDKLNREWDEASVRNMIADNLGNNLYALAELCGAIGGDSVSLRKFTGYLKKLEGLPLKITELLIDGAELRKIGYAPSKEMGACLQKLLKMVINGIIKNESDSLIKAAKNIRRSYYVK